MLESEPKPCCGGGDSRARSPGGGAKAGKGGLGQPRGGYAQSRTALRGEAVPNDGKQLQLLNPNLLPLNSALQLTELRDWRLRRDWR